MSYQWISTFGLVLDIIGAWFVAWEVVRQFKGKMIPTPAESPLAGSTEPTPEYQEWEKRKYQRMKIGLFFLTAGFLLQILGVWLKY